MHRYIISFFPFYLFNNAYRYRQTETCLFNFFCFVFSTKNTSSQLMPTDVQLYMSMSTLDEKQIQNKWRRCGGISLELIKRKEKLIFNAICSKMKLHFFLLLRIHIVELAKKKSHLPLICTIAIEREKKVRRIFGWCRHMFPFEPKRRSHPFASFDVIETYLFLSENYSREGFFLFLFSSICKSRLKECSCIMSNHTPHTICMYV